MDDGSGISHTVLEDSSAQATAGVSSSPARTTRAPNYVSFGRFNMNRHGLFASSLQEDKPAIYLSGPFEVLGVTHNSKNEGWGVLIAWKDRVGHRHELAVSHRLVMGSAITVKQAR